MRYLQGFASVRVHTCVDAVVERVQHGCLDVRVGQLQQVVQALVPCMEGAHLPCVLVQPRSHSAKQPAYAVPAQRGGSVS